MLNLQTGSLPEWEYHEIERIEVEDVEEDWASSGVYTLAITAVKCPAITSAEPVVRDFALSPLPTRSSPHVVLKGISWFGKVHALVLISTQSFAISDG